MKYILLLLSVSIGLIVFSLEILSKKRNYSIKSIDIKNNVGTMSKSSEILRQLQLDDDYYYYYNSGDDGKFHFEVMFNIGLELEEKLWV
jgi:hypothetical protein